MGPPLEPLRPGDLLYLNYALAVFNRAWRPLRYMVLQSSSIVLVLPFSTFAREEPAEREKEWCVIASLGYPLVVGFACRRRLRVKSVLLARVPG